MKNFSREKYKCRKYIQYLILTKESNLYLYTVGDIGRKRQSQGMKEFSQQYYVKITKISSMVNAMKIPLILWVMEQHRGK